MSAAARPHLQLVDEHGEVYGECPECAAKEGELQELYRKFKGQSRELSELRRDKEAEARAHNAWPILLALFDYWREQTGHKKARWSADRFWAALPFWQTWGTGNIAAAIAGLGYDAWAKTTKNGSLEPYDDWGKNLFKDDGTIERLIKRRPKDWKLPEQFVEESA